MYPFVGIFYATLISVFKNIAPVHSTAAAGPSALAQPPLSPYASSKSSLPSLPVFSSLSHTIFVTKEIHLFIKVK